MALDPFAFPAFAQPQSVAHSIKHMVQYLTGDKDRRLTRVKQVWSFNQGKGE